MKLYLIEQDENCDYDTYDSAVVAAKDENEAKTICPSGDQTDWNAKYGSPWCSSPIKVTATLIGTAKRGTKAGVICASFNAG